MTAAVARCPGCGHVNDDVTFLGTDDRTPSAGSWGLCIYCSQIGVFTGEGYHTREPTAAEREDIARSPEVARAVATLTKFRRLSNARSN